MTYAAATSWLEAQIKNPEEKGGMTEADMVGQTPPDFDYTKTSSARNSMDGISYNAWNVLDGDLATAWCEGVPEPGIGEWIELRADTPQRINSKPIDTTWLCFTIMDVFPGDADSEDTLISEIRVK